MNRHAAIKEENAAMDELARLSREIQTINLLIIHHRQHPTIVRRLSEIKARLIIQRTDERAKRRNAAEYI